MSESTDLSEHQEPLLLKEGQSLDVSILRVYEEWERQNPISRLLLNTHVEAAGQHLRVSTIALGDIMLFRMGSSDAPTIMETMILSEGGAEPMGRRHSLEEGVQLHDMTIKRLLEANPDARVKETFIKGQPALTLTAAQQDAADKIRNTLRVELLRDLPIVQNKDGQGFLLYMSNGDVDQMRNTNAWMNYIETCPLLIAFDEVQTENGPSPVYTYFTGYDPRMAQSQEEIEPIIFRTRAPGLTPEEPSYSTYAAALEGHALLLGKLQDTA